MIIRRAKREDFDSCYAIGKTTPEFRVSATEEFMDPDEFQFSIESKDGIFLIAEEDRKIHGFIYANTKDIERPLENRYACLVYLVVLPEWRRKGIANQLYLECEKELKSMGITHIYGWANAESGHIISFMEKEGFVQGHKYLWMDKKII